MHFWCRYCAPERLVTSTQDWRSWAQPRPLPFVPRVCDDQGRSDVWSLIMTWLVVLSGMEPLFCLRPNDRTEDKAVIC
jgi:hypothetical protein